MSGKDRPKAFLKRRIMTHPRFQNLCASSRGFNIFKKTAWARPNAYPGMVVASADALYFAIHLERMKGMTGAAIGGALGGAVEGMLAGKKKRARKKYLPQEVPLVEEMDLTDLPADVVEHPDWPVPWAEGPVIVAPAPVMVAPAQVYAQPVEPSLNFNFTVPLH